ncbi:hypothetical protein E2C01_041212 [Portunus trituberculatus]|uniref:Uncharacterized protein n=1 Tax=Portunus trituberculatus TaxID=210409 RepID=A0A5B7FSX6_PORTR|nr:hypothetical protein [Portunus trituberculatus]
MKGYHTKLHHSGTDPQLTPARSANTALCGMKKPSIFSDGMPSGYTLYFKARWGLWRRHKSGVNVQGSSGTGARTGCSIV